MAQRAFQKRPFFVKFVVSLTIFNDKPLLTIFNDDTLLTIVNIIVNNTFFQKRPFFVRLFFQKWSFFKKQSYKKRSKICFKKWSFSKRIVFRFLKVRNEWVVFKNDHFFRKRNNRFWKRLKNEAKKDCLTIVFKND